MPGVAVYAMSAREGGADAADAADAADFATTRADATPFGRGIGAATHTLSELCSERSPLNPGGTAMAADGVFVGRPILGLCGVPPPLPSNFFLGGWDLLQLDEHGVGQESTAACPRACHPPLPPPPSPQKMDIRGPEHRRPLRYASWVHQGPLLRHAYTCPSDSTHSVGEAFKGTGQNQMNAPYI